jgi:hypothetical protein
MHTKQDIIQWHLDQIEEKAKTLQNKSLQDLVAEWTSDHIKVTAKLAATQGPRKGHLYRNMPTKWRKMPEGWLLRFLHSMVRFHAGVDGCSLWGPMMADVNLWIGIEECTSNKLDYTDPQRKIMYDIFDNLARICAINLGLNPFVAGDVWSKALGRK